jgi:hypothetical protein
MRLLLAAASLVAAGALWVGSGSGPGGNITLAQARAFDEFPLVWAGESVAGLPLTAVLRRNDEARYVSFVYGDCTPTSDGGCSPPVEVQVWPASARGLGSYGSGAGAPVLEPTSARGVAAGFVGEAQLELYGKRSTVVVFSDSRERSLEVASVLRCLSAVRQRDGPLDC